MAVERIVRAIVRDEHSVLPVSNLLQGQYGIDGLCMSIPAVVGRNGVEDTLEIPSPRQSGRPCGTPPPPCGAWWIAWSCENAKTEPGAQSAPGSVFVRPAQGITSQATRWALSEGQLS